MIMAIGEQRTLVENEVEGIVHLLPRLDLPALLLPIQRDCRLRA